MIRVAILTFANVAFILNGCANGPSVEQDANASQAILTELTKKQSGNLDCVDPQLYGDDQWHYDVQLHESDWYSVDMNAVLAAEALSEVNAAFQTARSIHPSQMGSQKPNSIAAGLPAGTEPPSCNDVIAFSIPKISGDWAFVEENFTCCGGMNKSGQIVALRRVNSHWIEYAILPTYIS